MTEQAHDYERQIAHLKIALKKAREQREAWKDLAERHRDTAVKLRRELNETIDAYNDLYDMAEHGST